MKDNQMPTPEEAKQLIHPDKLRCALGVLGILFPFALVIGTFLRGCTFLQSSISAYYHTSMGDVFVGFLCAYAMFLFVYKGHNWVDSWAANLAASFALGIALFPTAYKEIAGCTHQPWYTNQVMHLIAAAGFFLVLSYFSLFLFTKTTPGQKPGKGKKSRNVVYRTCGFIMLTCMVLIAFYFLFGEKLSGLRDYKPVFWLEVVALWAFGVSWLTKGKMIFDDELSTPEEMISRVLSKPTGSG